MIKTQRILPSILSILLFWKCSLAFSTSPAAPVKVVVTGASGKTGRLVVEALLQQQRQDDTVAFEPVALVRSEKSAKALRKMVPDIGLDQIVICDIAQDLTNESDDNQDASSSSVAAALHDCQAMVICTSAMPVINKLSLVKAMLKIPLNLVRGKKMVDFRSLRFDWKQGQYPELVDYQGQKAQIDLAISMGMKQVVVVGSMGGTDPNNFLNLIGKRPNKKDGTMTGNGDILLWKRKAEMYLIEQAEAGKLDAYTIIHPGGLKDEPGGQNQYVLDVDDALMENKDNRSIARSDVANLCLAALRVNAGKEGPIRVALDVVTKALPEGETTPTTSPEEALQAFLQQNKVYDYSL